MKTTILILNLLLCTLSFAQLDQGKYKFYNDTISVSISVPSLQENAPGWSADIEIYNTKTKKLQKSSLEYMEANDVQWYQTFTNGEKVSVEVSFKADFQIEIDVYEQKKQLTFKVKQPNVENLIGHYKNDLNNTLQIEKSEKDFVYVFNFNSANTEACGVSMKEIVPFYLNVGLRYKYYSGLTLSNARIDEGEIRQLETGSKVELTKETIIYEPMADYIGMDCARIFENKFVKIK